MCHPNGEITFQTQTAGEHVLILKQLFGELSALLLPLSRWGRVLGLRLRTIKSVVVWWREAVAEVQDRLCAELPEAAGIRAESNARCLAVEL